MYSLKMSLKYQWSITSVRSDSSSNSPVNITDIKSLKVFDDVLTVLNLLSVRVILINLHSLASCQRENWCNFHKTGNLSPVVRTLFKSSLEFHAFYKNLKPVPLTDNVTFNSLKFHVWACKLYLIMTKARKVMKMTHLNLNEWLHGMPGNLLMGYDDISCRKAMKADHCPH
jgi:hypothetical protein